MKSRNKILEEHGGQAVWLASYPKSGNTWFRCLLSALFTGEVDINALKTDGIFSSRDVFNKVHDIDSRLMSKDETFRLFSTVFNFHISHAPSLMFIKVHDAYCYDDRRNPIFPKPVSKKVFYLVRNPLDVVGSFANHNNQSIDKTIDLMNKKDGTLGGLFNGLHVNHQFPQLMYDWSGHVNSWLDQKDIEVVVVRYEDMKKDTLKCFSQAMRSIEIDLTDGEFQEAIELAKFEKLRSAEKDKGFREKNAASKMFFRKGIAGGWVDELTKEQAQRVIKAHGPTMTRLGYEIPDLNEIYG